MTLAPANTSLRPSGRHRFCVAPMMDWTDRHCRAFHRHFTAHALLYTEMVTTGAVIHGDRQRLLGFDPFEQPVALQLGGSEPDPLAEAARIGEAMGYAEINLNCGCPSDRVQSGRFGACLMAEPETVAAGVKAMMAAVKIPVTVKCRIGIDDQDPEESLTHFVATVADAGVTTFIIHARKAWLKGLSPKENRDIPPLDYPLVQRLKAARPDLTLILNGGLNSLEDAITARDGGPVPLDGVMLGRAAYHHPGLLLGVDPHFYGRSAPHEDEVSALRAFMAQHMAGELDRGTPLIAMTRHILGLFQGRKGARAFRRTLSEGAYRKQAGLDLVEQAIAAVLSAQAKERAA